MKNILDETIKASGQIWGEGSNIYFQKPNATSQVESTHVFIIAEEDERQQRDQDIAMNTIFSAFKRIKLCIVLSH